MLIVLMLVLGKTTLDALLPGYDGRSVKALLPRLVQLDAAGLRAVRDYEYGNANRVTMIKAVDKQLCALKASPVPAGLVGSDE